MSSTEFKIPMLDLRAQHANLTSEILNGFSDVLSSGRFVLGEAVQAFESELATFCDAQFAIGCNSGTDALWLALRGLKIGPGDAVLCPAFSFFATAAAIVRVGAQPIFADIDPVTLNLDPQDALQRAEETPNLRAIISVDLFGRVCELGSLDPYCRSRGIHLIQDAAQSIGALDATGGKIGSRSDVACFSFYPTKNLGALGDAGGLITNDPALAETLSSLRVHGETAPGVYEELGINSRLDSLQAVALRIKLRHLESWTQARRERAADYNRLFLERGAIEANRAEFAEAGSTRRGPLPLAIPAKDSPTERQTYHRYIVRVPANRRDELSAALESRGIESAVFYPRGLHQQPALAMHAPARRPIETERACRETLALPLYPELRTEQVEKVVQTVSEILEG
jgi:dTDP-4-amino-4,6-dideoxygalactose transaminase